MVREENEAKTSHHENSQPNCGECRMHLTGCTDNYIQVHLPYYRYPGTPVGIFVEVEEDVGTVDSVRQESGL
jgi:hypothetical protein